MSPEEYSSKGPIDQDKCNALFALRGKVEDALLFFGQEHGHKLAFRVSVEELQSVRQKLIYEIDSPSLHPGPMSPYLTDEEAEKGLKAKVERDRAAIDALEELILCKDNFDDDGKPIKLY